MQSNQHTAPQAEVAPEFIAEAREVFAYFDTKGDQRISISQVGDVLRALDLVPTQSQIRQCTANVAAERITFEQFLPMYQAIDVAKEKHTAEEFVEGLSHFDKDGSSQINTAELRHLLTTLGERLTDEEVDALLANNMENAEGMVSIDDFVRRVTGE